MRSVQSGHFFGLTTLDLIQLVDRFPSTNEKIRSRDTLLVSGGPAANAAKTFALLGGDSALTTFLGESAVAQFAREDLENQGVSVQDIALPSFHIPAAAVAVSSSGDRTVISNYSFGPQPHASVPEPVTPRIALFDGHYSDVAAELAASFKSRGVQTVFDGGSWKPGTDAILASMDTAIVSHDFRVPGAATDEDMVEYLKSCGVKRIAVSDGANRIRAWEETRLADIEVPRVSVIDTNGAGDVLHGAFCFYACNDSVFSSALAKTAVVASASCTDLGTRGIKEFDASALV